MDDPNLDISINADSSGAVAAFDGLNNSVGNFGEKMGEMGKTFNKPLSHLGLQVFSKELLKGVGLAGEARPIVNMLTTAVEKLGGAFTFATGPIGMAVAGLTAAGAIIYKVVQSQKKHTASLDDTIASQEKGLSATEELGSSLDRYKELVKTTSPELDALVVATENYTTAQKKLLALDLQKQLGELKIQLDAVRETHRKDIESTAASAATMDRWSSGTKDATEATKKYNQELLKQEEDTARLKFRIAELDDTLNRYAKTGELVSSKDFYKKQADEAEKSAKEQEDAQKKISDALRREDEYRRRLYRESLAYTKQVVDSKYNIEIAAMHGTGAQAAVFAKIVDDAYGTAYLNMAKGAGDAFASMAVDGTDFSESMDQVFKGVVKSFISMIIEMEIRWAASKFLSAVGLGVVPSAAMPVTAHATGVDKVYSSPTLIMVGDGGEDERVQVTPRSQSQIAAAGNNSPAGNISVTVVNNIGNGDRLNASKLADEIGKQVIARIRGQGDLGFVRG